MKKTDPSMLHRRAEYAQNAAALRAAAEVIAAAEEWRKAPSNDCDEETDRLCHAVDAYEAACKEWQWLKVAPKVPMFAREPADYSWLTRKEFAALLEELPAHTRQLARFAVATGLRRTNITHLRWSQVDMRRRHAHILAAQAKAGKAITVPLNDTAMTVLKEQQGEHGVWVFSYQGEPVYQVATKAWRKAVTKIGRPGLRFHDLRHTWASWHVQAGTPLHALKELGGWADLQMVTRYGHLDAHSLREYAQAGGAFDAEADTPLAHSGTPSRKRRVSR